MNLDGLDDIVVRTSNSIVALRGYDGSTLWSVSAANMNSSPVVQDVIPSSPGPEVIYLDLDAFNRPVLYVRSRTGSVIWSITLSNSETLIGYDGQPVYSTPAVGDLDGDGNLEIVIKTRSNGLRAYDGRTGSLKWVYSLSSTSNAQTPTLIDLNRDGKKDVIFSEGLYATYHDRYLKAVNHNGSLMWQLDLGGYMAGMGFQYFASTDIDGNMYPEIFLGRDQYILRVNQNGSSAFVQWAFGPEGNSCWDASVVIIDINNDRSWEIVKTCDGDLAPPGKIRIFRASDGNIIWSGVHGCYTDPSVAAGDVDGDGCSEIVYIKCTSTLDSVYVLDGPVSSCGILSEDRELNIVEAQRVLEYKDALLYSVDGRYIGRYDEKTSESLKPGVYFITDGKRYNTLIVR